MHRQGQKVANSVQIITYLVVLSLCLRVQTMIIMRKHNNNRCFTPHLAAFGLIVSAFICSAVSYLDSISLHPSKGFRFHCVMCVSHVFLALTRSFSCSYYL